VRIAFQGLSGGHFNTAAQSVFENTLAKTLATISPGINLAKVSEAGASGVRDAFSGEDLVHVVDAYMVGIKNVFAFVLAGAAATLLSAFLIPPTRVPAHDEQKADEKMDDKEAAADASIDK
jgi:MFS transporter, DHA2 family, glioxin efflux transporter